MDFSRYRRPSAFLLLAAAVVFATAAVAGFESGGEGALILLLRLREHLFLLGCLAVAALTGAVLLGLAKSSSLRMPLMTAVLVTGVPLLLIGGWASAVSGGSDRVVRTESSPGRSDRHLVVVSRSGFLDPVWCVHVHQGHPPRERRWDVGCFNGDDEDNSLREAVWTAPDRIRMTTEGGAVHEVAIAPGGRPDRVVSVG
ncbi:hypothetical protein [Streptomyces sp. NPDC056883]|uniref:hypothetical protein n=1 Tax=Streptomyces sp. NPDC056883 TaxID=3345959 RepID=UPI0036A744A9